MFGYFAMMLTHWEPTAHGHIATFLRSDPEAVIFLAIAIGAALGRVRFGGFSLGNATAVLLVATIIGATITGPLGLNYPPILKAIAFALFVFAVGFHGGPQFFGSLGLATLTQVVFAFFIAAIGLVSALTASHLLGLNKGSATGLAAGALTQNGHDRHGFGGAVPNRPFA